MAEADPRSDQKRACPDCRADVGRGLRYCPACGRFVPGGRRPYAWITTVVGAALWVAIPSLLLFGYVWLPVIGGIVEISVGGYTVLAGDWEDVSDRNILIGTGIGLVLLAILAVVLRICGVGA